jgi:transposase
MTLHEEFLDGVTLEGGTTGEFFLWFIETILRPHSWEGAVVSMDNFPAHKIKGVAAALDAVYAQLIYLAPYASDFNPIENLWSKLKSLLRSAEARTIEALHAAIVDGLARISLQIMFVTGLLIAITVRANL